MVAEPSRWPSGFRFGKALLARDSLTIATLGAVSSSYRSKSLPERTGVETVEKYPGLVAFHATGMASRSGRLRPSISLTSSSRLNWSSTGRTMEALADFTPGRDCSPQRISRYTKPARLLG